MGRSEKSGLFFGAVIVPKAFNRRGREGRKEKLRFDRRIGSQ
jgi:hypothetical protein